MKEEGVNLNATTTTSSSNASGGRRKGKSDHDNDAKPAATAAPGESRTYHPLPWDTKALPPTKKARGADGRGGYLVQSGTLDVSIVGRGKLSQADFNKFAFHLARPTRLHLPTLVTKVFSAGHAVHAIALDANGKVYGWGRNEGQQLGQSQPTNVYWPTLLTDLDNSLQITQAATGKSHSLFLTRGGEVYALGSNKFGQCGVKPGPASETVGTARITAMPAGVEMAEVSTKWMQRILVCLNDISSLTCQCSFVWNEYG